MLPSPAYKSPYFFSNSSSNTPIDPVLVYFVFSRTVCRLVTVNETYTAQFFHWFCHISIGTWESTIRTIPLGFYSAESCDQLFTGRWLKMKDGNKFSVNQLVVKSQSFLGKSQKNSYRLLTRRATKIDYYNYTRKQPRKKKEKLGSNQSVVLAKWQSKRSRQAVIDRNDLDSRWKETWYTTADGLFQT